MSLFFSRKQEGERSEKKLCFATSDQPVSHSTVEYCHHHHCLHVNFCRLCLSVCLLRASKGGVNVCPAAKPRAKSQEAIKNDLPFFFSCLLSFLFLIRHFLSFLSLPHSLTHSLAQSKKPPTDQYIPTYSRQYDRHPRFLRQPRIQGRQGGRRALDPHQEHA